ncbi:uncharacterized protein LOC133310002 [Gastrolobium bilobum]|uniref:uncharacterized protein LOC133310002 n=1 Tax=Gastrolobium bilobum TaxID=150636 RepID=UPI002AB2C74A|nr:uncharacterized protein LOC133310002 [Gastrolobium bilobum]
MTRNRNNPEASNANNQPKPVLAAFVRPRSGRGATGGQCDPVAETLATVLRELTASRQANENLLKTNEDSRNAMAAMMNELRTLRGARPANRQPTPPHTATPSPPILQEEEEADNSDGEASHHSGSHSHHTKVRQPHVEHVDEHEAEERRLMAFRKHKPPSFSGGYDPLVAEKWLQSMEKIFRVMRCPDAVKLVYSVYMLEGEAEDWWTNIVQPLEAEGREITWRLFETLFLDNYFSREAREQKQNKRTLLTPAEMTSKFQWGLNEKMSRKMSNCDIREFSKFVNQCRKVEEVYSVPKSKKSSEAQASGASGAIGSTSEKGQKMDDRNIKENYKLDSLKKSLKEAGVNRVGTMKDLLCQSVTIVESITKAFV